MWPLPVHGRVQRRCRSGVEARATSNSIDMEGSAGARRARITWVFDVISPFSYLALKQLPRLPANVSIDYVPVLFAALLNHYGQLGPAEIESKRRFTYRFALWRARKMGIEMRFPPAHPFNPLGALRLIIAAGSTRQAVEVVIDAVFRDGRDVSRLDVLQELATALNIEKVEFAIGDPAVKQKLRQNTDWAIAHGIFGVPTFLTDEQLFWGHDSFEMLLDHLEDPGQWGPAGALAIDNLPIGVTRSRPPKI